MPAVTPLWRMLVDRAVRSRAPAARRERTADAADWTRVTQHNTIARPRRNLIDAQVVATARTVRTALLSRPKVERNLAGYCGLASMLIADAIGDVDVFRFGFFMRRETFLGKRGRYPNSHAWCQVGEAIIDVTATQFGKFPAIYIVAATDTDRYVECADGIQAVDEIMGSWWFCSEEAEYRKIYRRLRALDDGGRIVDPSKRERHDVHARKEKRPHAKHVTRR